MTSTDGDARLRVLVLDRNAQNPYSLGLARALEQCGIAVTIGGPANAVGHPFIRVYPRSAIKGRRVRKALDVIPCMFRFAMFLLRFRPNIIHAQWPTLVSYMYARTATLFTRSAIVFTDHNPALRDSERRHKSHDRFLRVAKEIIVHGPAMRDAVITRQPKLAGRVHTVEHGDYGHVITRYSRTAARARLNLPTDATVYTFVGQLLPRKGLDVLLDACGRLGREQRTFVVIVAGTVQSQDQFIEVRAQATDLRVNVRWYVSADQLPQDTFDLAISAANQVVLPFTAGTQSGTVMLGMSHGRCVVTTDTGDIKSVVGHYGLTVPVRDVGALADAMRMALDRPEQCDELGRRALARVSDELSWARLAPKTLAVYRAALLTGPDNHPTSANNSVRQRRD